MTIVEKSDLLFVDLDWNATAHVILLFRVQGLSHDKRVSLAHSFPTIIGSHHFRVITGLARWLLVCEEMSKPSP